MHNLTFHRLTHPSPETLEAFSRWEMDSTLLPFLQPNPHPQEIVSGTCITIADLENHIKSHISYLITVDDKIIGEVFYQIDPPYLYKKETGTAWPGITIGEPSWRGQGIGFQAMQYLESEIKQNGLKRIELGVFEFNTSAIRLYQRLGYKELSIIPDFTYWHGKYWNDIRMEKVLF